MEEKRWRCCRFTRIQVTLCGPVPQVYLHRRFGVMLCRTEISISFCIMKTVLSISWTSSYSSYNNKCIFSGQLFWFWFWFLNLIFEYVVVIPCLAHAQNIYLFILKILFSLDQMFRVECFVSAFSSFNLILYEHFSFCFASSYLYELLILV